MNADYKDFKYFEKIVFCRYLRESAA